MTEPVTLPRRDMLRIFDMRRRLKQHNLLDMLRIDLKRKHDRRTPLQLRRLSKGLRRALARRVELVG